MTTLIVCSSVLALLVGYGFHLEAKQRWIAEQKDTNEKLSECYVLLSEYLMGADVRPKASELVKRHEKKLKEDMNGNR